MFNTSKIIATATVLATLAVSSVSAATIERAGGAKVAGESTWVAAVTVCETNQSECFKITTEKEAAGRVFEESEVFGQLVVAPRGSFMISNSASVQKYVSEAYGFDHVEIILNNGEDENSHW